jgi:hypothetical protein
MLNFSSKILNGPCPLWVLAVSLVPGVRWLCWRRLLLAPSGRQRSDFMSFQISIISFVPAVPVIAIPLAFKRTPAD